MIAQQGQPQAPGSSASQQKPGEGVKISSHVPVFKPDSFFKIYHQDKNLSSTLPTCFSIPYSSSVDQFCQMHQTCWSNMHHPFAPMLVPLTSTRPATCLMSLLGQRLNSAALLQTNVPHFFRLSSVSSPSPVSNLPVLNVSSTHGTYLSHGSESSLVQNQKQDGFSDPISADFSVTVPQCFSLPTAERYFDLLMFCKSIGIKYLIIPQPLLSKVIIYFDFFPFRSSSCSMTPLGDSTDSENFKSGERWEKNIDELYRQATPSLEAAQAHADLSSDKRCCITILIPEHRLTLSLYIQRVTSFLAECPFSVLLVSQTNSVLLH